MKYTLFSGCSFTAGTGFDFEKQDPALWTNQLHNKLFAHTTQINVSSGGRSNAGIFQDTVKALLSYPVETAVVQWTNMPRYLVQLGFELYETFQLFSPNSPCREHKLNNITYSSSYLNTVRDRFVSLNHDFYEILDLVEYVNSIAKLAKLTQTQVYFVNGLCPWDQDFFDQLTNVLPDKYTQYTQKLLNVDNRDDSEIFELYNKMHSKLTQAGGIRSHQWLNLYNSLRTCQVDTNQDQLHPGPLSNKQYAETFCHNMKKHSAI